MPLPQCDVVKAIQAARRNSQFIQEVRRAKSSFALLSLGASAEKNGFKPLTPAHIRQLEKQGNTASDWKRVWAASGFDPKRVNRCAFLGTVLLGVFRGEVEVEGASFPTGLSEATLASSVVGSGAFLRNVRLVNRSVIGEGAVLFDVGTLTARETNTFANGLEALIAIETGGREVPLFAELTVDGAWTLSRSRGNKALLSAYSKELKGYLKEVSLPCNVIGPKARILHTPKIEGLFLGEAALIDSATAVTNVTVLSSAEEKSEITQGAIVKSSILQWGCEVASEAIVDTSLLIEHSHVERHGKVTHSILGPNTGVAEGEVTSALLGPFVGFHHQALLIAALWPEGKGNVGYGANIGSNHTAKAPDQEIWPGEGTFFGLGVNIKFPMDMTHSPYTIIASGVNMLPQKLEFPFSLVNTPAASIPGISPAYNELIPGWVLSDNIYMVKRNEGKYEKRNKARRSKFDFEVFRPEIVDLMVGARKRLQKASGKELYTAKEVEGLGKNYMLEASRKRGIEAYIFYIRYYALLGLKRELDALKTAGKLSAAKNLLGASSTNSRWEHERGILREEFPGSNPAALLTELARMQEKIAQDVQGSKEKDDRRGAEVIEDYREAHPPTKEDSFVKETWGLTEKLRSDVEKLIGKLHRTPLTEKV